MIRDFAIVSVPAQIYSATPAEEWLATASREDLIACIRGISRGRSTVIEVHNDFEAVSAWLATYDNRSRHTQRAFRLESERFLIWLSWTKGFSLMHLPDVTLSDVTTYYAFLGKAKTQVPASVLKAFNREKQPFSNKALDTASLQRARGALACMFDVLRNLRGPHGPYLQFNPWANIREAAGKKSPVAGTDVLERGLSEEEWQVIQSAIAALPQSNEREQAHYHRVRWVMALLYYALLRRSEAAALKMSNFYYRRNCWWLMVEEGKGSKTAKIVAPKKLTDELVVYRRFYGLPDYPAPAEEFPAILPVAWNGHRSKTLSDQSIYLVVKEIGRRASEIAKGFNADIADRLEKVSPHWTRHTGISHAMDKGADPRSVQSQARHSSLNITARYDHKPDDKWSAEIEKM